MRSVRNAWVRKRLVYEMSGSLFRH